MCIAVHICHKIYAIFFSGHGSTEQNDRTQYFRVIKCKHLKSVHMSLILRKFVFAYANNKGADQPEHPHCLLLQLAANIP